MQKEGLAASRARSAASVETRMRVLPARRPAPQPARLVVRVRRARGRRLAAGEGREERLPLPRLEPLRRRVRHGQALVAEPSRGGAEAVESWLARARGQRPRRATERRGARSPAAAARRKGRGRSCSPADGHHRRVASPPPSPRGSTGRGSPPRSGRTCPSSRRRPRRRRAASPASRRARPARRRKRPRGWRTRARGGLCTPVPAVHLCLLYICACCTSVPAHTARPSAGLWRVSARELTEIWGEMGDCGEGLLTSSQAKSVRPGASSEHKPRVSCDSPASPGGGGGEPAARISTPDGCCWRVWVPPQLIPP